MRSSGSASNGQRGSSTGVYSSSPSYYNGTTTISSGTNWITRGGNGSGGAYQWDKMYVNSTKTPYGKYDQAALGSMPRRRSFLRMAFASGQRFVLARSETRRRCGSNLLPPPIAL